MAETEIRRGRERNDGESDGDFVYWGEKALNDTFQENISSIENVSAETSISFQAQEM